MRRINLVTLTAPVSMISDQLTFLTEAVSNLEIPWTISTGLDPAALNVVIEGFTPFSARYIREFCDNHHKKISVVITEHLDLKGEVIFNDVPLSETNEYMPNAVGRLRNLCQVLPDVRFIWILGHLPEASNVKKLFPQTPVVHIPYTSIKSAPAFSTSERRFQLSFTGTVTRYRSEILNEIGRSFKCCHTFSDDVDARRAIIADSQFTLQIPQHERWRYLSPMRILFALRAGTPILNISRFGDELFDGCVPQIEPDKLIADLSEMLRVGPREVFARTLATYNRIAEATAARSNMSCSIRLWQDLE